MSYIEYANGTRLETDETIQPVNGVAFIPKGTLTMKGRTFVFTDMTLDFSTHELTPTSSTRFHMKPEEPK